MSALLVALGAALGAPARFLLDTVITARVGRRFPWGTLAVNLLGSAAAGVLAGLGTRGPLPVWVSPLLAIGFCGAFTTASTLTWESVALAEDGELGLSVLNLVLSLGLGLSLATTGFLAGSAV